MGKDSVLNMEQQDVWGGKLSKSLGKPETFFQSEFGIKVWYMQGKRK